MKVQIENIGGTVVKDNKTYILTDNNYLEHLTLSQTILKPGQSTRGHSHENQEEIYVFTTGNAIMQIGDIFFEAQGGDTFLIKAGEFHKVSNANHNEFCFFTCIFEKYDRKGDGAIYKN
jgi:mannose-6-phosphate isomerase-like protein (cupin superfamily)